MKYFLTTLFILLVSCGQQNDGPYREDFVLLDTVVQFSFYTNKDKLASDTEIMAGAVELIDSINNDISNYGLGSIAQLNEAAGSGEWVELSPNGEEILTAGKSYYELTKSRLNIMLNPIIKLWGIGTEQENVPSSDKIEQALDFTHFDDLEWDVEEGRARLKQAKNSINTGALGKGYIADRLKTYLASQNIENAIIDLGGNVVVLGEKDGGLPFKIGLQTPEVTPAEPIIGILTLAGGTSISTAGDYQRYYEEDGVRYHHIFDPATGSPALSPMHSVTILSNSSLEADALATALFVRGEISLPDWLPHDLGVIMATEENGVFTLYVSENIVDKVEPREGVQLEILS